MIWGETQEQKRARLALRGEDQWKPWFAWHPVDLDDGRKVWLQTVDRCRHRGIYWWVYRSALAQQPKGHGGGDEHR